MAKARKKKASSQKSKKESSDGGFIIVIIFLVVIGAVAYGMFFRPGAEGLPKFTQVKEAIETSSSSTKEEAYKPAFEEEPSTKKSPDKIIDRSEIGNLDGAVEKTKTNENLPTYQNENPYYFTGSFDFTWPAYSKDDAIVEHAYFTLKYNEKTEQADWVAYSLSAKNLENAKFKRTDNFREDPKVKTKSAHPNDYKGSGYDRGHLAPAADFTWNKDGLDESFYMSNMSPQLPGFNRGVWKKLEDKTRTFAKSNREVYVVTGPIFKGKNEKIGKNKVAIPDQYFKVIIELNGQDVKGIGFILNHEKSSSDLSTFAVSIDQVEEITKLDFFPSIPDDMENKIECCARYSDW